MGIDAEMVQELLDMGLTKNKVATLLGVHNTTVARIIKREKLEQYIPFDSEEDREHLAQNFEWLWEEDKLEGLLWQAFDGDVKLTLSHTEDAVALGKYVKNKYGNLKRYFARKNFTRVVSNVIIECKCGKEFDLSEWYLDRTQLWGLSCACPDCRRQSMKRHAENNPDKVFKKAQKRREFVEALPFYFNRDDYRTCLDFGKGRCLLSNANKRVTIDHFVAVSTGHCGTYLGNVIPLVKGLNSSKNRYNPFDWAQQIGEYAANFEIAVRLLAFQNGLTPREYENFVNWCYENPRNVDEIKADQRHSIEIWREATGQQFPLPAYTATYRVIDREDIA